MQDFACCWLECVCASICCCSALGIITLEPLCNTPFCAVISSQIPQYVQMHCGTVSCVGGHSVKTVVSRVCNVASV